MASNNTWVHSRHKLLRHIRLRVENYLGQPDRELKRYIKEYHGQFTGLWRKSRRQSLQKAILRNDLILGGDFHAFAQSQRSHLRILRELPVGLPLVLALECFEVEHQKLVDEFMAGKLSEKLFLKRIGWQDRWGFPWENFKPLLALAKERRFQVAAINHHDSARSGTSLRSRDRKIARELVKLKEQHLSKIIYTIIGETHIVDSHLPLCLYKLEPKLKLLQVFIDGEELYFRHAKTIHRDEVYHRGGNKFCLFESPPWVKWQSYLMFLEQNFDYEIDDVTDSATDVVSGIVDLIAEDFDIQVDRTQLQVSDDLDRFFKQVAKNFKKAEKRRAVESLIEAEKSVYLPEVGLCFLARHSVNHAAALAGQYIHSQLSHRESTPLQFPQDFERAIWIEAIGFFFSKWFNHRRKAKDVSVLQTKMLQSTSERSALELSLDQRMREILFAKTAKVRDIKRKKRSRSTYIAATNLLGPPLGERLFYAVQKKIVKPTQILKWLERPIAVEDFPQFYMKVVRNLEGVRGPTHNVSSRDSQL